MKTYIRNVYFTLAWLAFATFNSQLSTAHAQGTAFTYQGRLNSGGSPATGSYDIAFTLYTTNTSGVAIAGPVTNTAVTVTNGLFTTTVDFGNAYTGTSNWLAIAVSTNAANSFTTLVPRQQLTPVPYAIYSANAGSAVTAITANSAGSANSVSAANITGTISSSQLSGSYSGPVNFLNGGNNFGGNGSGLTNISLSGVGPAGTFTLLPFYFGPPINIPLNAYAYAVQLLDVNGDGLPDLILNCEGSLGFGLFEVYTNAGGGSFILASTNLDGNGQIYSIAAGDFNGDGKIDLAVGDSTGVTVYQGFGDGTFTPVLTNTLVSGIYYRYVSVADINGDGHPDIVVGNGNENPGYLNTLLNFGAGGFVFTLAQSITINDDINALTTRDVNGDGQPDIIYAGLYNAVTVYTNRSGVFTLASTNKIGNQAVGVVVGDVNGDGRPDLISVNAYNNNLTIFTNAGGGIFNSNQSISVGHSPTSAVVVTNSAGLVTYLGVANAADGTVGVLANDGHGNFNSVGLANVGQFEEFSAPVQALATADVNGDGKPDFVAATGYNEDVTELLGYPQVLAMQNPVSLTNAENVIDGYFTGNGSALSNLNASQITSGTLSLSQLPVGVPLLSSNQTFTGQNIFSANNNYFYGNFEGSATISSFFGRAGGLTGLNASQLTFGTIPLAAIPTPTVVTNSAGGVTLSGTFSGNGVGLTNVWQTTGNTGTTAGVNYLGTADNQPLELHVDGGRALRIEPTSSGTGVPNIIGGYSGNLEDNGSQGVTIGGGGASGYVNHVSASLGTITGGSGNTINTNGNDSTIGGGRQNTVDLDAWGAVIGGGHGNWIQADNNGGGGLGNSSYSTISGGFGNVVGTNAINATIGGGGINTNSGNYATIPGGYENLASGNYGFAAGDNAEATNNGAFVWSDSSGTLTKSFTNNQFMARASGGVVFLTGTAASPASYATGSAGVALLPNATAWTTVSDRNAKKNFTPVNTEAVLDKLAAIPIQQWNYKWESDKDVPNIGPMAQDFKKAFYPGRDDRGITTLEFDGVELAAIQGLNQKLNEKDAEIQTLKQQNDSLAQRLTDLEATVKQLAPQK